MSQPTETGSPSEPTIETSKMKLSNIGQGRVLLDYDDQKKEFESVEKCIIFILTHPEIFSSEDYDEFLQALNN
jgi:hypothetical protein